jgi:membrane-associated phospholipid phosphatase
MTDAGRNLRTFMFWIAGLFLTVIFTLVCVRWLDKPVALLVHDMLGARHFPDKIAHSPGLSFPLASALLFVVFGLAAIMGRKFSRIETAILLCNIAVLGADAIKNLLKFVFGRTWPDSWEPGILSLIHDNAYGFHFFQQGKSYESFPSGHAAVAAAVMSVLWILFPRLRALCAI